MRQALFPFSKRFGWLGTKLLQAVATLALATVLGATLVCLAPGSGVDERELDPSLGAETIAALRQQRAEDRELWRFLPRYAAGVWRGDFGRSEAFQQPVSALIGERLPVTLRIAAQGLALAWIFGLGTAMLVAVARPPGLAGAASAMSGALLAVPTGLLAIALVVWRLPPSVGIAAGVFPKVYRFGAELLAEQAGSMHWLGAKARGVGALRLLSAHLLLPASRPLAALAAVSVVAALGLAVPMEALTDTPGLGQLAVRATLARDLRLLVGLTLVVTAVALVANLAADAMAPARREEPGC